MKKSSAAPLFVADIHRLMPIDEEAKISDADKKAIESDFISRLFSRSEESNTRLREVVLGFLEGNVDSHEFQRTVEEHCFIYGVRSDDYQRAAAAAPAPCNDVAKSPHIIDFPKTNSMNHLINDRGETVQAVGSPGSIERAQCERPEFVKELASYNADILAKEKESKTPGQFDEETTVFAAQRLHERGIIAEDEATALLAAAGFKKEIGAPVLRQLQIITQDQERSLRGATLPVPSGPALKSPEISG